MLLEIKWDDTHIILNSSNINVWGMFTGFKIRIMGANTELTLECDTQEKQEAVFAGLKLALNGLDFIYGETGYFIKPLFCEKNEKFYRHLMLKECLADRNM